MQSVSWLAFVAHNTLSRTVVHFFPFSGSVSAPYATECRLTIFGVGISERSVTLDGARLGQPDGVRLEDAFPEVAVGGESRLLGLQIDLESTQQRLDLSASACFIEFVRPGGGAGGNLRYRPMRLMGEPGGLGSRAAAEIAPCIIVADRFQTTSFVVVNRSAEPVIPAVRCPAAEGAPWQCGVGLSPVPLATVAPGAVVELEFDAATVGASTEQECSWGRCATRALDIAAPPPGVAYFALGREPEQRRPISVSVV